MSVYLQGSDGYNGDVSDHCWYRAYKDVTKRNGPDISENIALARVLRYILRTDTLGECEDVHAHARWLVICLERSVPSNAQFSIGCLQTALDTRRIPPAQNDLIRRFLWLFTDEVATYSRRGIWRTLFSLIDTACGDDGDVRKVIEDGY